MAHGVYCIQFILLGSGSYIGSYICDINVLDIKCAEAVKNCL